MLLLIFSFLETSFCHRSYAYKAFQQQGSRKKTFTVGIAQLWFTWVTQVFKLKCKSFIVEKNEDFKRVCSYPSTGDETCCAVAKMKFDNSKLFSLLLTVLRVQRRIRIGKSHEAVKILSVNSWWYLAETWPCYACKSYFLEGGWFT